MVGTLSMVFLLCYIVATLNIGTRILDVHANTKISRGKGAHRMVFYA